MKIEQIKDYLNDAGIPCEITTKTLGEKSINFIHFIREGLNFYIRDYYSSEYIHINVEYKLVSLFFKPHIKHDSVFSSLDQIIKDLKEQQEFIDNTINEYSKFKNKFKKKAKKLNLDIGSIFNIYSNEK